MADPKPRAAHASAPESTIKKADDRHRYGDVRSEPLKHVDSRVLEEDAPRPKLKQRRIPRKRPEDPYPEPNEKNEPPARG